MKKKLIALVMATAMIATMTGCGSSAAGNKTNDTQAAGGDSDITLKVWVPQNQVDTGIIDEQEKAFAEAHPEWNITWKTEIVGEDMCKDELLKDVEKGADVFFFANDQLVAMQEAGAIAKLGGEAKDLVDSSTADSVKKTVMIGDDVYAIPFTHNTFFMYYDKTLLDETDVATLEGIMNKETAEGVYNFNFDAAGGWKTGAFYYGAGCTVFGEDGDDLSAGCDWNGEKGLAVTNYLVDLITNPKCIFEAPNLSELVTNHQLGAWFDGAWNYDLYHDAIGEDLGLAVIPTFNPDGTDYQLKGFYGSKAIGVNAQSKNMQAAVAFATFLGNEENQVLRYEKSAQIPANTNAGESDAVKADTMASVIVAEANTASVMQPTSSIFGNRYWSNAGALTTEINSGDLTKDNAQEKLDKFVELMNAPEE